jgi:hypothetical protein
VAQRLLGTALVLAILGGCNAQSSDATGPSKAQPPKKEQGFVLYPSIPSSPDAKVGTQHVDPETGAKFLKEICLDNRSDFSKAIDAMKKHPFVQGTKTGKFYHRELSLVVHIWGDPPDLCAVSMGWSGYNQKHVFDALEKWNYTRSDVHDFTSIPTNRGKVYAFYVKPKIEE